MIKFKVFISHETAIRNGRANVGEHVVELDDAFVASLHPAEREELIACYTKGSLTDLDLKIGYGSWKRLDQPEIIEATPEAVRKYLDARLRARTAAAVEHARETREKYDRKIAGDTRGFLGGWSEVVESMPSDVPEDLQAAYRGRLEDAAKLLEQIQAEKAAAQAAEDARIAEKNAQERQQAAERKQRIQDWILAHGTKSMLAREVEGLLPEKELLDAVREELFAPLEGLPRYERLADSDVKHDEECERFAPTSYRTEAADELTEKEYERLRTIRDLAEILEDANDGVSPAVVQVLEHRAWCTRNGGCPDITMRRSVKVKLQWNGYTLTREYALTSPGEDSYGQF